MLARIVVLVLGLFLCRFIFVLLRGTKAGTACSMARPVKHRLLAALGVLTLVQVLFWLIWIGQGDKDPVAWLDPILVGVVPLIPLVTLLVIWFFVTSTDQSDSTSALPDQMRWGLLAVVTVMGAALIYLLARQFDQIGGHVANSSGPALYAMLAVLAAVCLALFLGNPKPDAGASPGDTMPMLTCRLLPLYLLFFGIGLIVGLWSIASLDFSDAGVKLRVVSGPQPPASTGSPNAVAATETASAKKRTPQVPPAPPRPVLRTVILQVNPTTVPSYYLVALGDHFTRESLIRLGGQPQAATIFLDPQRLQTPFDQAMIDTPSELTVDVLNGDKTSSELITVATSKTEAQDSLTGQRFSREQQLLLLALLAGALGSFIHALKSFADYVGNRTFAPSWCWWYITRPFLGAALALVFYAVVRSGLVIGTPADAKAVNPFGVIAIAALVGMFADKASAKLAEIFDTLFKGADHRRDRLGVTEKPVIRRLEPATIAAGSPDTELTIRGYRLGTVSKVKLGDEEREPEKRTDNRVTVTLTVEDLETPREIKVAVIGASGESAPKVLKITEAPLILELSVDTAAKILTITGERLATVSQVRIGDRKATPEKADETTVTVKLNDDELTKGRTIQVVVIGESGESPPKDLSTTP